MAKKASGTNLAIRKYLNELPANVWAETTLDELLANVKEDKSVNAAMKKLSMTDSSIKQLIQKVKTELGYAKPRTKKKVTKVTAANNQPELFVDETVTETDAAESQMTIEESLQLIATAQKKFPALSEAIKIAALQRAKLAEQQAQLDSLFGG